MSGPPDDLVRALTRSCSLINGVEWHDETTSTNALALAAAARGVQEIHVVAADRQTAGRGRLGRRWHAPPGSSLLLSLLLRPRPAPAERPLLPLLAGLVVAEAVTPWCDAAVKWPNDVLVGGRKLAGVLTETAADAVVVGIGINVDWRETPRPEELAGSTSLAEAAGRAADRWELLAGILLRFADGYTTWNADPRAFLPAYRARCATIGAPVRVTRLGSPPLVGVAVGVGEDGALQVADAGTIEAVRAGDVEHVRPS